MVLFAFNSARHLLEWIINHNVFATFNCHPWFLWQPKPWWYSLFGINMVQDIGTYFCNLLRSFLLPLSSVHRSHYLLQDSFLLLAHFLPVLHHLTSPRSLSVTISFRLPNLFPLPLPLLVYTSKSATLLDMTLFSFCKSSAVKCFCSLLEPQISWTQ